MYSLPVFFQLNTVKRNQGINNYKVNKYPIQVFSYFSYIMFLRNADIRVVLYPVSFMTKYGKTTSASCNYSYNGDDNKFKRKTSEDLISVALHNISVKEPQDWTKIKQFIMGHKLSNSSTTFNEKNIDGMIMASVAKLNRLDLARSYLEYLNGNEVKPNLATIGRYLKLLYENYKEKLSKAAEEEILSICHSIQTSNPVLDSRTLESMVLALSLTKQWKKCIELMDEVKKTSNASASAYSALISAAFLNKEETLAWELLREALALEKILSSTTYLSLLKTVKRRRKKENIIEGLEKMFMFFKESEIHCQEDVVSEIVQSFSLGCKSTVNISGHCEDCNTKLEKLDLTDIEFEELKEVFLKNAIFGKDIFIKTNPEEMSRFQNFVDKMGKYDVVLDGLNIAYSKGIQRGPRVFSDILCTVISHFAKQNKSILMLGRIHMNNWPKNNWNYIKQNADVFLTQNISQDDPYLLYCALHSGKDTIIVTKDLMRGHKFLLKERKYKILFDRWLSQRQVFLQSVNQGRAFFRFPPPFSAIAQKNRDIWHIPYTPENESINETFHKTWLCLPCN